MRGFVRKILIYGGSGDRREVDLAPGLNVITGDSKTGKSALIEIMDYCLFSSRSSIPKGIITKFASLFAIVLRIEKKYLVIGRPAPPFDLNKAYLKVETEQNFLDDIDIEYFNRIQAQSLKSVQADVERHLGLSVMDMNLDGGDRTQSVGKASMRNFVSFLFQHQNLLANKHALFYRFDDYNKRQRMLNEFPVFMKWVDSTYYSLVRQLEEKQRALRAQKRINKVIESNKETLASRLFSLIEDYYALIGLRLDPALSLTALKALGLNLPSFKDSAYSSSQLIELLLSLETQRTEMKLKLAGIEGQMKELEDLSGYATDYSRRLIFIDKTFLQDETDQNQVVCPLCHSKAVVVEKSLMEIRESRRKLKEDIRKTGTYQIDNSDQIDLLRKERDNLKAAIRNLSGRITRLQEQNHGVRENRQLRDQVMVAKGVIEASVKQLLDENTYVGDRAQISDLEEEISKLRGKINGYDLKTKYSEAAIFLSSKMNSICEKLDFEEELKPAEFHFDLDNFDFYHHHDRSKIHLSEMGSGANWLACHLSLFLSFLWLTTREEQCVIPTILFLDQPSQVYFPKGIDKTAENQIDFDENMKQVTNIFDVLISVLDAIQQETRYLPQIVVMEHADNLSIKKRRFDDLVRKRWSKDGEKLI